MYFVRITYCFDVDAFLEGDQDVKLVDNDSSTRRYITLSYCWGQSKTFTTTTARCGCEGRITFSTLPKTFDVIVIARELRVRYIWIDALCIVQDDRADWERESARWAPSTACLHHRRLRFWHRLQFWLLLTRTRRHRNWHLTMRHSSSSHCHVPLAEKPVVPLGSHPRRTETDSPEIDASPLSKRGWVCQERILSPRILHYTQSQLSGNVARCCWPKTTSRRGGSLATLGRKQSPCAASRRMLWDDVGSDQPAKPARNMVRSNRVAELFGPETHQAGRQALRPSLESHVRLEGNHRTLRDFGSSTSHEV